jgi:hypothetical protein
MNNMKVKCINNKDWLSLTLNKIYDIISIDDGDYIILDDNNDKQLYLKKGLNYYQKLEMKE